MKDSRYINGRSPFTKIIAYCFNCTSVDVSKQSEGPGDLYTGSACCVCNSCGSWCEWGDRARIHRDKLSIIQFDQLIKIRSAFVKAEMQRKRNTVTRGKCQH